tara:strand:- start:512 stop:649 length:138 start_codon:yes stop_codon:yes gene_type:complete
MYAMMGDRLAGPALRFGSPIPQLALEELVVTFVEAGCQTESTKTQ